MSTIRAGALVLAILGWVSAAVADDLGTADLGRNLSGGSGGLTTLPTSCAGQPVGTPYNPGGSFVGICQASVPSLTDVDLGPTAFLTADDGVTPLIAR